MIQSKESNPEGLHARYHVARSDGSPVDPGAEYFVLRLDDDGDPAHVAACRVAVRTYAEAIAQHIPQLAADILARYPQVPDMEGQ